MADNALQIFHDLIETSRLGQDRKLMGLLKHHNSAESPLYQNVLQLINGLNLREFDTFSNSEQANVTSKDPIAFRKSSVPVPKMIDGFKVSTQEVPQLTKTQRRMSFDLMQIHHGVQDSTRLFLRKPPEAAVSNVNIVTKVTDLENKGYKPVRKKSDKNSLTNKIISYQSRFKLVNKEKSKDPHPAGLISNILDRNRVNIGNKRPTINLQGDQGNGTPHLHEVLNSSTKSARRTSLVGENLPLYIKLQLGQLSEPGDISHQKDTSNPHSLKSSNAPDSLPALHSASEPRPVNRGGLSLLANSEFLHLKINDSESTDNSYGNGNNESTISDADKEYILPGLFNRFLDYGNNDALDSASNDSGSEEDQLEDDEDDYLFNSQAVI